MARKSETQKRLEAAGFTIHKVFPGARWFEVTAPLMGPYDKGSKGYVLVQSFAAWHFFYADIVGTASSSPEKCHLGGLGDAIGTDSQMKTYKKLLEDNAVPREIQKCDSVWAAMTQAYND